MASAALVLVQATAALARPPSAPSPRVDALVGARVVVAPGRVLDDATVLMRDGVIVAVGPRVTPPPGARSWDMSGLVVHAGFIDAHLGLARLNGQASPPSGQQGPGFDADPVPAKTPERPKPSATGSGHPRVHPEIGVTDWLAADAKTLESLRQQGFTAACVVPDHGVLRGRDAVIALGGESPGRSVIAEQGDIHAAFEAAGWGSDEYPGSVMGAMALLRQTFSDADWYRRARQATAGSTQRVDADEALRALADALPERRGARPRVRLAFDCHDVLDVLRAGELASELGARLRVRAAGDEYRRIADVVALRTPLVVPVAFPAPPKVADEAEWVDVSDEQLRHWHRAPDNARWLHESGVEVSLTTDGLKDVGDFGKRVQRAIRRGLRAEDALAMVTTHPAALLGLGSRLGTVEPGRLAHLVVATGLPFEPGTEVREAWVDGVRHVVARPPTGPLGTWAVDVVQPAAGAEPARTFEAKLTLATADAALAWEKASGGPKDDGEDSARKAALSRLRVEGDSARADIAGEAWGRTDKLALVVNVQGDRLTASTDAFSLEGVREKPKPKPPTEPAPAPLALPPPEGGPLVAGDDVLLRGVTAWTCAPAGVLEGVDVLIRDGRIAAIGEGLDAPGGVPVVDAAGRHVTPGLIDAHSHAAIVGGVNEGTNSCTAEVRIGDVVNSETIDIYRLLAGGLTTANLLHGSANCMGGQSQVIRLKWGAPPADLAFREAWPMIKFALGENVKQANWGEKHVTRYPQTRMGVEQFMREKFQDARDWDEHWRAAPGRGEAPPRRDYQLECLAEILRGERKVHCHSYRQDEILGLMRVAEEFGFRINTFQHILEGYKVADEMAAHGAGGSSFTDWWAYKFEVYDAIPYNPALMWQRGVLTSVNSDSTELARRMQLEAAKVAKWGDVPEAEALKFVTLNAARQLGIDAVVGSLETGKAADLAVWSGSPLSTSSLCESTWIEGVKYFDRAQDLAAREEKARARAALIDLARQAQEGDEAAGEPWSPSYWESARGCSEVGGSHLHEESQP